VAPTGTRAAAICAAVLIAPLLAACGSSSSPTSAPSKGNGLAAQSPAAILGAVAAAAKGLHSVHITGSTGTGGRPIALDMTLVANKGATGSMSLGGAGFRVVAVGKTIYISGSDAFWRRFAGPAASLFAGRWLKAPETGQFGSFAQLTNLRELFGKLLIGHGRLTKGDPITVNGVRVVPLTDKAKGGTLYVATTGAPYPVEIYKSGSGGGHFYFSRFNQPATLTAPANAIDINKLG